ncbi:MAG: glycosyltransferase [Candidatus Caldarchaeum sp.]
MSVESFPLVSIGIPFYNPGKFFADAIRSVFAQTYVHWELLLVDDGSDDGSLELAKRIKDPRVKVFSDGKHLGLVARLNQIAQMASGFYVARMDADDLMHPERIARQVAFLQQHPEINVVDTGAIVLDREGVPAGLRGLEDRLPSALEILKQGGFLHASIMAKREWFLQHPYDPDYPRAEDRELWVREYRKTKFAHIPEPLYFYHFIGRVRLKEYLQSYRSERQVIARYGWAMVGVLPSLYLYVRSLLKSGLLCGLSLVHKEQFFNRYKYRHISPDLLAESIRVLQYIREQKVPGWES